MGPGSAEQREGRCTASGTRAKCTPTAFLHQTRLKNSAGGHSVPRTQRSAQRCAAEPGSIVPFAQLCVPTLRSSAKGAARVRDRSGVCSRRRVVICPSGILLKRLSIPLCKNISLHPSGKSSLQIRAIPPHQRGVSRSSRTRGVDAVDAAAFCARWDCRAGSQEFVSDQQHADERRFSRTAKSCGPDAPTLASSFAEACRPNRVLRRPSTLSFRGCQRVRATGRPVGTIPE